jgi:hypothetical protein
MFKITETERERGENRAKKTATTNDIGIKFDDFSHAKIRRHHTSATVVVAAAAEKDDEEARIAGSRRSRVLIFTLFFLTRSLVLMMLIIELLATFFSRPIDSSLYRMNIT